MVGVVVVLFANVPSGQRVHQTLVADGTVGQQMVVQVVEHWPLGMGAVQQEGSTVV